MPALAEYSSVHNTVFNIISEKGFQIWYDQETELYCAEKDGWDFMAETPCSLLGIIAIYEFKKPEKYSENWWKEEKINYRKNLSKEKPEYTSVIKKKDS